MIRLDFLTLIFIYQKKKHFKPNIEMLLRFLGQLNDIKLLNREKYRFQKKNQLRPNSVFNGRVIRKQDFEI